MLTVYPSDRTVSREGTGAALVLAHGAGAGQTSRFMVEAATALAARGIAVATFDFPYVQAGRKVPDKAPVLEAAWRAAIDEARATSGWADLPLFIGGKSMGGRIASHLAAQGVEGVSGAVFLGYPLHPPGRPEQRRDRHLPAIALPMLFVQGTRDQFGTAQDIAQLLPQLQKRAELFAVADGDHSFKVRAKIAGRSQQAALDGIFDAVADFVRRWSAPPSAAPAP
jgi:predicted alpha/beta-hydrolase family hydrolase